ncbi:hypothetical protein ACU61A_02815 [Pseudonocardia sichuanensis]
MSSETDHPRQRTVAELLAAHGDANATGRRRRRREPDEPDEGAQSAHGAPAADPAEWRAAPPREPSAPVAPPQREPNPPRRAASPQAWDSEPERRDPGPWESAPWASAQDDPAQRASGPGEPAGRDQADWGADEWDADPWDPAPAAPPAADARWDAQPAQPSWDGAAREARYPGPPIRDRAPRREPEEQEREPRRAAREPVEAPAWEPRAPEAAVNGREARPVEPRAWDSPQAEPPRRRAAVPERPVPERAVPERPVPERQAAEPERPTEQMPRVQRPAGQDPARTTRIPQRRRAEPDEYDAPDRGDDDGGPATMVGAAPAGAESWHRARTDGRRRAPDADAPDDDDGPATMVGAAPAGAESWHRARTDGRRGAAADGGPPTQAAAPLDFDDDEDDPARGDYPAGLGRRGFEEEPTGFFGPQDDEPEQPKRRSAAKSAPGEPESGPSWPAVIAQWIAGAIGGAALWVGFRFLWRDLPVVALAAAVLVTVGLVVIVRALLRSSDLRTTLFAVLVGLLLTVSPAILVLLGR